jgi:hypothetical protein
MFVCIKVRTTGEPILKNVAAYLYSNHDRTMKGQCYAIHVFQSTTI